jgi:carboxymethylenebutenolidase
MVLSQLTIPTWPTKTSEVRALFAEIRCTHTVQMDWLLPGVPPTGRPLELVTVVIVAFEGGKIHHEHIHWDQASALVQLGLLDPANLPVAGYETARKMLDPASVPSNLLMKRTLSDELL